MAQRHPHRDDLLGRVQQRGDRRLETAVSERYQQAHRFGAREQLGVGLARRSAGQLLGGEDPRLLGLERARQDLAQAEQLLGAPVGLLEQTLDRPQVEAVGLHLADETQPREVLGAVVADPFAHLRCAAAGRGRGGP